MEPQKLERDEVAAAMAAQRELGPQYELAIAESLVGRVNAVIDAKLAASPAKRSGPDWAQMSLGLGSLALSVPLAAVVTRDGSSTAPLLLVFGLIAFINLAYALSKSVARKRD
ncbi:hypothetical protein Sme01_09170 [Sphaerisporangium melleum]|uniref:Uncharacterized protein n=1 Tax=Sphaerisporangium melleum TaxID=321316 RepID=A0A917QTM7_9ACTN|nr:hypothetical protein [Sphaerisporangium melleum]GGK67748.1 hypothetical protein GCM10007964_08440 [Sphaerisporangium melleum]GII68441.1 hypothetical protein Sme01_09170 [Sphaerisporangium melleum]